MKDYFGLLSKKQKKFISDEFGITEQKLSELDEDDLYALYDKLCDIEVDETIEAGDGDLSERGEMAVSIVTVVGNALAEAEGFYEEQE